MFSASGNNDLIGDFAIMGFQIDFLKETKVETTKQRRKKK
jgi:hypothetical protein